MTWTGVACMATYEGNVAKLLDAYSDRFFRVPGVLPRTHIDFCHLGVDQVIILATERPYVNDRTSNLRVYVIGSSPELNRQTLDTLIEVTGLAAREPSASVLEDAQGIAAAFEHEAVQEIAYQN